MKKHLARNEILEVGNRNMPTALPKTSIKLFCMSYFQLFVKVTHVNRLSCANGTAIKDKLLILD